MAGKPEASASAVEARRMADPKEGKEEAAFGLK
jgi:hypothetical protein